MNKLLAFLLALCLLVPTAFASDTVDEAPLEIDWETGSAELANYEIDGDFYAIPIGEFTMTIWIPAGLESLELAEADYASYYIAAFADDERTATIAVQYVPLSVGLEGFTLEMYAQSLASYGAEEIETLIVNGLDAISYVQKEHDSMTLTFMPDGKGFVEFTFWPLSEDGAEIIWPIVASSIQLMEEADEAASAE